MHRSPINPGGDAGYLEQHGALSTAGDARQFFLDELSLPECRRVLGGGNATESSMWSLLDSCDTDDLLDAQQESAIRVHVSSPWKHRHWACRQEEEKLLVRDHPWRPHDSGRPRYIGCHKVRSYPTSVVTSGSQGRRGRPADSRRYEA